MVGIKPEGKEDAQHTYTDEQIEDFQDDKKISLNLNMEDFTEHPLELLMVVRMFYHYRLKESD